MDVAQGREPPYSVEVEQSLLGSLLVNNDLIDSVSGFLDPDHFYDPLHHRIFETICRLRGEGRVTPVVLGSAMKTDPGLVELGSSYLGLLASVAPAMPNILQFARILTALAKRRALIRIGEQMVNDAYESEYAVDKLADSTADQLFQIAHGDAEVAEIRPLVHFAREAVALTEQAIVAPHQAYLTSGLATEDEEVGPLFRGDLDILGGATSMAKTAKAQKAAMANARLGSAVAFFSLEMAGAQLAMRWLAQETGISSDRMRRGRLSTAEFEGLALAPGERFHNLPLYVDGTPHQSVAQMRAKCLAVRRASGRLDLVVIDHLQFVAAADPRAEERDQLRQVTRDLKTLAKDLNVAVLLLSHITKENERRVSKRPVLADLYGSSGIQQNADTVRFVFREHYYLTREKPDSTKGDDSLAKWLRACELSQGWAEIFSDKNRMGKIGTARVRFTDHLTEFSDPEVLDTTPGLDLNNPVNSI